MHSKVTPPRTIMEVYEMLPEGTLVEIIDGGLRMLPFPTIQHQRVKGNLLRSLTLFVDSNSMGEVLIGPCDVNFDNHSNVVQPDILFISNENSRIIDLNSGINGVPDMLIEILSKGNSNHDLITKKELYENFGVKEYWIINPETKETTGYTLNNGIYLTCGQFEGQIISPLLKETFSF